MPDAPRTPSTASTPSTAGTPSGDGREVGTGAFVEAFGGVRGLVDSALPATVFVLVRLVTDELAPALWSALGVGVGVLLLRVLRGQTVQQALSGFFGLAVAVLFARATGTGEGFFLPGIITTALTGVGFLGTLLARRPAVGLVLAAFDAERYGRWRESPALLRACTIATAVWTTTFFIRAGVAYYVYSRPGDADGTLLVVVNVVKWPLIALAAVVSVALVRRAQAESPAPRAASPVTSA